MEAKEPITPARGIPSKISPRKKLKVKRKATSPPPKDPPPLEKKVKAITLLLQAQKAILAALRAERAEKEEKGEVYIEDNSIQILANDLEEILEGREIVVEPISEPADIQVKLDKLDQKIDLIASKLQEQGLKQSYTQEESREKVVEPSTPTPTGQNKVVEPSTPTPASRAQAKPISFADIVRAAKEPSQPTRAFKPLEKQVPTSYKDRRLILQEAIKETDQIDSKGLRDQINEAFKKQGKTSFPVIATVTKAQSGRSIVLTSTEQFNAEFLKQNRAIWQPFFCFKQAIKDTTWSKVVVYSIPTEILNPITRPVWLSTEKNRSEKRHASVLIAFETKEEADRALRNRLYIAGVSMRVTEFTPKSSIEQCIKCQGFNHSIKACKKAYACSFCGKDHPTRLHTCLECKTRGNSCVHTVIRCSNCLGPHKATDKTCPKREKEPLKKNTNIASEMAIDTPRAEVFSHVQL
jgi:hypothetical protein